jgi:hypothetical protein
MDIREFSRAYARSPLGILSLVAALGAAFAAYLAGAGAALSALALIGVLAAFLAVGLALGAGQRAAASELEREAGAKAAARLAQAAEARRRLAALRISEPEVARARDALVLEAGSFVEACGRKGTYDPEGVEAILGSLELVDAWLKEADESSVEKRFGLPNANPFPQAAVRTAEALRGRAALVAARRAAATGEIPGADRLSIEEELK